MQSRRLRRFLADWLIATYHFRVAFLSGLLQFNFRVILWRIYSRILLRLGIAVNNNCRSDQSCPNSKESDKSAKECNNLLSSTARNIEH